MVLIGFCLASFKWKFPWLLFSAVDVDRDMSIIQLECFSKNFTHVAMVEEVPMTVMLVKPY